MLSRERWPCRCRTGCSWPSRSVDSRGQSLEGRNGCVCSTYSLELRLGRAAGSLEVALALLRGLGSLCVDSRQLGSGGADGRESGVATYVSTAHFVWCLVVWVFEGIRWIIEGQWWLRLGSDRRLQWFLVVVGNAFWTRQARGRFFLFWLDARGSGAESRCRQGLLGLHYRLVCMLGQDLLPSKLISRWPKYSAQSLTSGRRSGLHPPCDDLGMCLSHVLR